MFAAFRAFCFRGVDKAADISDTRGLRFNERGIQRACKLGFLVELIAQPDAARVVCAVDDGPKTDWFYKAL